jgi:hypothetical protein
LLVALQAVTGMGLLVGVQVLHLEVVVAEAERVVSAQQHQLVYLLQLLW